MNQLVKDRNKWAGELMKYLRPIVWCEKCGKAGPTDTAHRKKRRFITTREEYFMAAKLCRACHQGLDENWNRDGEEHFSSHAVMEHEITQLILNRDTSELMAEGTRLIQAYIANGE